MLKINNILTSFTLLLNKIKNVTTLENLKVKYLGRNGIINSITKEIKTYSPEDRANIGRQINNIKHTLLFLIKNKKISILKFLQINHSDEIDLTLPSIGPETGTYHIITKTINEIETFFQHLGFNIIRGKEIDNNYYNFEALNISIDHPARTTHDTFFFDKNLLLRTHTSNMQIHFMKNNKPPFKIISSGKVYRRDSDITHTPMFHQIEGFFVSENVSISQLKGLLIDFLHSFFNKTLSINVRASYFPFTDPSMEIDIQCASCLGEKSCVLCNNTGWIEILGCGLIHPVVLKNCNVNTNLYNGFAFGMGIERLSMIKYKINDLRLYFENNIDFLKQFS